MASYRSRGNRDKKGYSKTVTYDPNHDKGLDPKYRGSKMNPFANGGKSAGQRIRSASGSNSPAEDDSDFDPRRHGNRRYRSRGRR